MTTQHGQTDEFVSGPLFAEVGTKPHDYPAWVMPACAGFVAGVGWMLLVLFVADRVIS